MQFENLALTGWSYEKGDKEIPVEKLLEKGLPKRILSRNPVPSVWIYNDDSSWVERLENHVLKAAKMANINGDNIQGFFGVHNGYKKHPEGASPVVMGAFGNPGGFMFDFSLGCASIIVGAQLSGLHMKEKSMHNVIIGSVQMINQYTTMYTDGNCLFADSIGAIALSEQSSGNLIKFTQIDSDPTFRDMFLMDENAKYTMQNTQKGKDLSKFMANSFAAELRNACKAMKTYPIDIDYIAISCSNYAASKMVLDAVNFPIDRSGIECLTKVPHMGTNDLIYQIEFGLEQGMIKKGSKILVSGTSLGFSIGTMAIEWGCD